MTAAEQVIKDIENKSENNAIPLIGPEKGTVLTEIIKETHPLRILEIGTNIGYSSILMADELTRSGLNNSKIITLEINPEIAKEAEMNFKRAKVDVIIEIVVGNAIDTIPKLEGLFDLVFLDAEKKEYYEYLKLIEPKLNHLAVIVADNVGMFTEEMWKFLEYVRENRQYISTTYDFSYDTVEVSVKSN
jgi:predicted O-methyltransferase YrrM